LTPEVICGVEHVAVLESGESDAIQLESPDDHLGVVSGGRDERVGVGDEEEDEEEWVEEDMDRRRLSISTSGERRIVWMIMSAPGAALLTLITLKGTKWQRSW
jgi:hypothetical protein